jgi:predicted Rossmann fold flavoprotein
MTEPAHVWPVAIVGAGAAGLLAAIFVGRAGVPVLLLETRPRPGAKIRMSGGGRCNVLPSQVRLNDYHTSGSRNSLRNILTSWPLDEVRAFFTHELGIPLKRESTGKLFPVDDDPRRVLTALLQACAEAGATLWGEARVGEVVRDSGGGQPGFLLRLPEERSIRCRRLILATGGLSLPRTGSDGAGLSFARRLGHGPLPSYPALVPLLAGDPRWKTLAGVTLTATLSAVLGQKVLEEQTGGFLFTHRGFSGPVVLDLSHHLTRSGGEGVELLARWGGQEAPDWDTLLQEGRGRRLGALLARHLPRRLGGLLLELARLTPEHRVGELTRPARLALVELLVRCPLPVQGSEGYRTAEVTGGGIPLAEISPRTLESRLVPGLYFAGEMLDATGRIGGYNFLWAWVTGRRAGAAAGDAARAEGAAG